jgi:hypothetical protein
VPRYRSTPDPPPGDQAPCGIQQTSRLGDRCWAEGGSVICVTGWPSERFPRLACARMAHSAGCGGSRGCPSSSSASRNLTASSSA